MVEIPPVRPAAHVALAVEPSLLWQGSEHRLAGLPWDPDSDQPDPDIVIGQVVELLAGHQGGEEGPLEDLGSEILTASNGNDAVTQAEEHKPDVVVLDMMLPKRSGFLVMERLKRDKARSDPPRIIMITGNQGLRHKTYAETLGVDAYLNKPFRMERLIEAVKNLLG